MHLLDVACIQVFFELGNIFLFLFLSFCHFYDLVLSVAMTIKYRVHKIEN